VRAAGRLQECIAAKQRRIDALGTACYPERAALLDSLRTRRRDEDKSGEERGRERLRHLRQTAVRSRLGFITTQPVLAETNAQVLGFMAAIAGAAFLASSTSRAPYAR
jgi:hypothetical protein